MMEKRGALYVIVCGSSSATFLVEHFVRQAQAGGWEVCVITTPMGRKFVDLLELARLTGHPVRSDYKEPDEPDLLPRADAVVVYPATFRTINNWANGNSDTLAVGLLCEYTGLGTPIVAVPCLRTGSGLDTFPAFPLNLDRLRTYGVRVLYQPEKYPERNHIPAEVVLDELHCLIAEKTSTT